MVSHELLILVIESRYPGLVHGRDYWVGHPLDEKGEHCGDAFIAAWHVGDRPDINELLAECDKFAPKLAEQKERIERNSRLNRSDWTQNPDLPSEFREKWAEYRTRLRDLPKSEGWPMNINWPKEPK
ncbi:hypothetical protein [Burkholderia phage BCSR52]|uniref:Phage tail assembly chaperone protein n=1 Tax=Burkholderia phage BCSR52 TaxID=2805748 RepID=A0A889IRM4_9CAUD|nr:hypothetical protein [Burkholderia phage BCSR52]